LNWLSDGVRDGAAGVNTTTRCSVVVGIDAQLLPVAACDDEGSMSRGGGDIFLCTVRRIDSDVFEGGDSDPDEPIAFRRVVKRLRSASNTDALKKATASSLVAARVTGHFMPSLGLRA